MIKLCETDKCTGCGACVNSCPQQCIMMCADKRGFLLPQIDTSRCIGCRKCEKVCPELQPVELNRPRLVLAGCEKKEQERNQSASGGAAGAFYKEILHRGGVAYGVVLNDEHYAVFERTETADKIEGFRGSKYIGSLMGDVYQKVRKDLEEERGVLFIGMSCQVAGLLRFLGKNYKKLITVDILCHGMPSHRYFKEYMEVCEEARKDKVCSVSFRENDSFRLKCEFSKSVYEQRARYDKYYAGYTSMLFYRDSCYSCRYAGVERCADITLGDFWGYKEEKRLSPTSSGVSMIFINTEKGGEFFETLKDKLTCIGSTIEKAVRVNSQLKAASPIHPLRKEFMEIYAKEGFQQASEQVIGKIVRQNRKNAVKTCIRKCISFPYRGMRRLKRDLLRGVSRKNIGKIMRTHWRNQHERRRLQNTDFTILSNTCIGGIVSHDMGLQFLSPTVNLYIRPKDFVKFVSDLKYYLSLELVEIIHTAPYPVAKLGDITVYLKHFASFEEAKKKWEERKERIRYDKIYLMMTDRDFTPPDKERRACGQEVLEEFDKLPYKKVCFTGKEYEHLTSCKTVRKNKDGECVNIITDIVDYSGKRLYQYAENFDYIDWLNEQEEVR